MMSEADGILPPACLATTKLLKAGLRCGRSKTAHRRLEVRRCLELAIYYPEPLMAMAIAIPAYLGAIIQEWQENLGVQISVRQLETENFIYNLKQEKDEMFTMGWIS